MSVTSSTGVDARPDDGSEGHAQQLALSIVDNVERVVRGRRDTVELVAVALLSGGHVLVDDVPGSGKTTLARAFARTVGGSFGRIQGTPDLMPSDITGTTTWNPATQTFTFSPGPVFAHVVVVDEINRTPPRTQSAFLEVMEEGAVTIDGHLHRVPEPFFVLATQNPHDHGTYPLPAGQLDRFAVRLRLGHLEAHAEYSVVREQLERATVQDLAAVVTPEQLCAAQRLVRRTHVAPHVLEYAVQIVRQTRQDPHVHQGASSRAALVLVRSAQARATCVGRTYVSPDDVKAVATAVLAHRLVAAPSAIGREDELVAGALTRVPVPLGA